MATVEGIPNLSERDLGKKRIVTVWPMGLEAWLPIKELGKGSHCKAKLFYCRADVDRDITI